MKNRLLEGGLTPAASGSCGALRKLIASVGDYLRVAFHGEPERSERGGAVAGAKRPLRASAIKIAAAVAALSAATSCGFHPLYSRNDRAQLTTQIESVEIVTNTTRQGQMLKAEIQDQVNPDYQHAEKLFVLTIKFTESEVSLFINPDGTSSRGDLVYSSAYNLTRKSDGKLVDTGTLTRISSYNIGATADFATFVSREDARQRGILELAQDYKLRLANLMPKINNPNAAEAKPLLPKDLPQIHTPEGYENRTPGL